MSGYKKATVTLSEADYHRLLEAENRLRFQQSKQSRQYDETVDQSIQKIYTQVQEMEARQFEFIREVTSSNKTIQEIEKKSGQLILEQGFEYFHDLENFKEAFIESAQELVSQQGEYYKEAILKEHANQQNNILKLNRRMVQMNQVNQDKNSIAREWIENSQRMINFIVQNYDHSRFIPDSIDSYCQDLNLAIQNLNSGIVDAAILGAQQVYMQASKSRVELERMEQEWTSLQQAALCGLFHLESQITEARLCPAIDLDGNELEEKIPVDIWANARLSVLLREILQKKAEIEDSSSTINLKQLNTFLLDEFPIFQERLVQIIHQARVAVISSQLRINIAELVIHALEGQGFVLAEGNYENNAMDQAFSARMENLDGSQIQIRIVPSEISEGSNDLFLRNEDSQERTQHELSLRANEIRQSLGQLGLQVTNLIQMDQKSGNSSVLPDPKSYLQLRSTE